MRIDKLTTKFQEALGDAQTLALGKDHAYIDPAHVLLAMLQQQDGPKALLQRAGVNMTSLMSAANAAVERLPQVTGQDQVQVGPELVKLMQAAEKSPSKEAIHSLPVNSFCWLWPMASLNCPEPSKLQVSVGKA